MRKKYTNSFLHSVSALPLFFLLTSATCLGQKIDSLEALLNGRSARERCNVLYELSYEYVDFDNLVALQYASESLDLANKFYDSVMIVKVGRIRALALKRLEMLDSSLLQLEEILPIARRKNVIDELMSILNSLGTLHTHEARYDEALQAHFESLQLRELYGNKSEISISLHNIGLNYYKMMDYEKALLYYNKSLKLKNEAGDRFDIESLLLNISLCYTYEMRFGDAKRYLDQLLTSCNGNCSEAIESNVNFNFGVISYLQEDYVSAAVSFLSSYQQSKSQNDQRLLLDNIIYLGQVHILTAHFDLAERYLNEAEVLIEQGAPYNLELIKIYKTLYTLYEDTKDFQKVAKYQQKYIQLKDSIYNEELTRNLMRVEGEYLERENTAKIKAQNEILSLNEAIIFRQRLVTIFVGIAAVLLVVLAFVLYKHNQRKRLANQLLELRVRERTRELELNRDSLQRTMDERSVVFRKVSMDARAALATVKGLCSLGLSDEDSANHRQYLRKIELTSEELLRILTNTLSYPRYSPTG